MISSFKQLNVAAPILKALAAAGYQQPTAIQEQTIPLILKGRDLMGCAQTGTGKTAAFAVPVLQLLSARMPKGNARSVRALILSPTRELALQIGAGFTTYGKYLSLKNVVLYGGVAQAAQTRALKQGADIVVATPGRLMDLMDQGYISLNDVELLVLDEADRMLDMGFVRDVKKIVATLPPNRQTLLFSATLPRAIQQLAGSLLRQPEEVSVTPVSGSAATIQQSVFHVAQKQKRNLLLHVLTHENIGRLLVFSRTKHGADKLVKVLQKQNITAEAIHGNKTQNARQRALYNFKNHRIRVLVATDIAARGIDIDDLTHVLNFDLPEVPETYVHRIGRTGRAGMTGTAIAFCDPSEQYNWQAIQKLMGLKVPVVTTHPFLNLPEDQPAAPDSVAPRTRVSPNRANTGSTVMPARRGKYRPQRRRVQS